MLLNAFSKKLCPGLPALKKTGRMMKILTLFLFAGCLQLSAKSYAQGITLSLNNVTLAVAFTEIQHQSSFHFVYTSEQLTEASKVSLAVKDASIEKVLEICFKD